MHCENYGKILYIFYIKIEISKYKVYNMLKLQNMFQFIHIQEVTHIPDHTNGWFVYIYENNLK